MIGIRFSLIDRHLQKSPMSVLFFLNSKDLRSSRVHMLQVEAITSSKTTGKLVSTLV